MLPVGSQPVPTWRGQVTHLIPQRQLSPNSFLVLCIFSIISATLPIARASITAARFEPKDLFQFLCTVTVLLFFPLQCPLPLQLFCLVPGLSEPQMPPTARGLQIRICPVSYVSDNHQGSPHSHCRKGHMFGSQAKAAAKCKQQKYSLTKCVEFLNLMNRCPWKILCAWVLRTQDCSYNKKSAD